MAGPASGFSSTLAAGLSRLILWLATAAFCISLAIACTLGQPAPPQTTPAGAPGPTPGSPAPAASSAHPPSHDNAQATAPAPPAPRPMPADASRGLSYARAACAECHQVEASGRESPYSGAPAFHRIALTPGMTSMALNVWLHTSHPSMPNLIVPRDRLDDLLAYFVYLRSEARTGQ